MVKCRVKLDFVDAETKIHHKINQNIEVSAQRAAELAALGYVQKIAMPKKGAVKGAE